MDAAVSPAPEMVTESDALRTVAAPRSSPVEPPVEPTPEEPVPGQVRILGDAESVVLVAGNTRLDPGLVPAGSYTLEAVFPGLEPMVAGEMEVAPGERLLVTCRAAFTRCAVRDP